MDNPNPLTATYVRVGNCPGTHDCSADAQLPHRAVSVVPKFLSLLWAVLMFVKVVRGQFIRMSYFYWFSKPAAANQQQRNAVSPFWAHSGS